eukprot:jgi/Bigna1/131179/aug1.13_g5887
MRALCERYGKIKSLSIVEGPPNKNNIAFVNFYDKGEACDAQIGLEGARFRGSYLRTRAPKYCNCLKPSLSSDSSTANTTTRPDSAAADNDGSVSNKHDAKRGGHALSAESILRGVSGGNNSYDEKMQASNYHAILEEERKKWRLKMREVEIRVQNAERAKDEARLELEALHLSMTDPRIGGGEIEDDEIQNRVGHLYREKEELREAVHQLELELHRERGRATELRNATADQKVDTELQYRRTCQRLEKADEERDKALIELKTTQTHRQQQIIEINKHSTLIKFDGDDDDNDNNDGGVADLEANILRLEEKRRLAEERVVDIRKNLGDEVVKTKEKLNAMVLEKEKTLTKLSKSLEKLNESRDHIANLTRFSDSTSMYTHADNDDIIRVGEDLRELRGKEARASSQLKVEAVAHRTAAARLKKEIQDIRRKLQNEAAKSEKAMQDADGAKLAEKKAKDDLQTLKKDMVKLRATAKKAEEALIEIRKEFMTVRIQKIDISKDANERKVELEKAQELINSKIEETAHLHALCAVRTKERDELLHEVQNSRNLTQELRKALAAVHKDMNHLQTREIATIKSRKDAERREYDANARANKLEQELRDIMIELNVISGEVANLTTTTSSSSLNAGNGKSHYKIQPSRTVPRTTMMTMETAGDGEVELPPLVTEGGATRSPTQPRK